jgi:ferric-dicitrate binding protein FerR (iron transport regulator)
VLGTRFSVENSDGKLRVECFEGKVKVSVTGKESIVEGGNVLTGIESSESETRIERSGGNLPSFARFEKNYLATDIRQVIQDLSVFFSVSIIYEGKVSRSFSGNFDTGNCDEALGILSASMNLQSKKVSDNSIKIY